MRTSEDEIFQLMQRQGRLVSIILDFGKELILAGEETWRAQETLREIFDAYAFVSCDLYVTSACIETTVVTGDGRIYTQIKNVGSKSLNVERLYRLNKLSEEIIARKMGVNMFREKLDEIKALPGISKHITIIASVMAASGFAVYYKGGGIDALIAAVSAVAIALLGITIGKKENNPLIYNAMAAFVMEMIILNIVYFTGSGHVDSITNGAMLLLVSGLGITNGIKDIMHRNTVSGLNDITHSMLGAAGIAAGISLALFLFSSVAEQNFDLQPGVTSTLDQFISCVIGCAGFSFLSGAKGRVIVLAMTGSALTCALYLLINDPAGTNYFYATMAAACFVALYGNVVSALSGIPSTVFLLTSVFPLIPGSALYYTVYGGIFRNNEMFHEYGRRLILVCGAIALGYIIIEALYKYTSMIKTALRKGKG